MPITQSWMKYGESIQRSPSITLAAYLGDEESIETAEQHGIPFPTLDDFKKDRYLKPSSHKLDLTDDHVEGSRLMMTILLWGKEPVFRAVNALSLLQLAHQTQCEVTLLEIRDQAAFALQRFVDDRSEKNRSSLSEQLKRCNKPYEKHEQLPDSADAELVWYHLGAPWFALESVFDGWKGRRDIENEHPVPQAHSTFCHRNSVWAQRTMDAAAHWSSDKLAQATVKSVLIRWATSNEFSILP